MDVTTSQSVPVITAGQFRWTNAPDAGTRREPRMMWVHADAPCGRDPDHLRGVSMPAPTASHSPSPTRPAGSPWSVADGAVYLGISTRHLRRLIDAGRVRIVRIGRRVLIPDAEVQR